MKVGLVLLCLAVVSLTPGRCQSTENSTLTNTTTSTTTTTPTTSVAGGPPVDAFMFIRPPLAVASKPTLVSKTDSSLVLEWTFDAGDNKTKAVDVTNVTTARGLLNITRGTFDVDGDFGPSSIIPAHTLLHPVLSAYSKNNINVTMPLYTTIPDGKRRVFLRKPVKRFVIEYQPVNQQDQGNGDFDSSGWQVGATLDVSARTVEVDDLHPGVVYRIRVCSANSQGKGACGDHGTLRTADVPGKPPAIRLSFATTTSLEIIVNKPETINGAGLTSMTLEMARKHSGPWDRVDYNLAAKNKLFTGLEPGGVYFFRCSAWNKIGPSPVSDMVSFETNAMVPKRVTSFQIDSQEGNAEDATTTVHFSWKKPNPRGRPITQYELQKAFGSSTSEDKFFMEAFVEKRNLTVSGLAPGKMFHFRVRAFNDVGAGNFSDIIEVISAPAVTTVPGDIQLVDAQPRSLSLAWERPHDFRGAPPVHYLLQMQPVVTNPSLTNNTSKVLYWDDVYRGQETQAVVSGGKIRPATTYKFRVKAVNIVGDSETTPVARFSTSISEPDAPGTPTAVQIGTNFIQLRWNNPSSNGSPLKSFKVEMATTATHNRYLGKLEDEDEKTNNDTAATASTNKGEAGLVETAQSLVSQTVSVGSIVSLRPAEDDDSEVNNKFVMGKGKELKRPCKAIHPSVYDADIPQRFTSPAVIPGSQAVYPSMVGSSLTLAEPNTTLGGPASLNLTLPNTDNTTQPQERVAGADGFAVVYEGTLNYAVVTGLFPGVSYTFRVQASNVVGTSPKSNLSAVQTLPTVPRRPNGPRIESRGFNYIAFSWPEALPRGVPVTSYVVQISNGTKDRKGNYVFQNACADQWAPALGGVGITTNFTTMVDPRAGVDDRVVQVGKDGSPMDHCKKPPENEERYCCVNGLEREVVHHVRIAATSSLGPSDFGPATEMRTRGEGPLTPLTPSVLGRGSTWVTIGWRPPPSGTSDTNHLTYHVEMTDVEFGETHHLYSGAATNFTKSALLPNSKHWFRIQAENHNGRSPKSEFVEAATCGEDGVCDEVEQEPEENDQLGDMLLQEQLATDARFRKVISRLHPQQPAKQTKPHKQHHSHK